MPVTFSPDLTPEEKAANVRAAHLPVFAREGALPRLAPVTTGVADVDRLGDQYDDLAARHRVVSGDLRRLRESGLREAEAADRAALADALAAGKKDPGTPKAEAARKELAEATRMRDGLADAAAKIAGKYRAAVAVHHGRLTADAAGRLAVAAERFAEAVTALEVAWQSLGEAQSYSAWVEEGPDRAQSTAPRAVRFRGDLTLAADVLAVLRSAVPAPVDDDGPAAA
jgi:hypothetical protein